MILLGAFNKYAYSLWPIFPKTAYFSSFEPQNLDRVIRANNFWFSKLKYLQLLIKNIKLSLPWLQIVSIAQALWFLWALYKTWSSRSKGNLI